MHRIITESFGQSRCVRHHYQITRCIEALPQVFLYIYEVSPAEIAFDFGRPKVRQSDIHVLDWEPHMPSLRDGVFGWSSRG